MRLRLFAPLLLALIPSCTAANLSYSTYLRDGFTPTAIASDPAGNVYLAGSSVVDPASGAAAAAIVKLDANASRYLYLSYIDAAQPGTISGLAADSSGNAYVTGITTNPDFPVLGGGQLGTPPTGPADTRTYVAKISPTGIILFSVLIGGSCATATPGIALASSGQIIVSGQSASSGFPTTPGAFTVPDSRQQWFLMELDPTASKVIFSATGIGGQHIAVDAAGNIYAAGSSSGTGYPTTPGAYQTTFVQGYYCTFVSCGPGSYTPGLLQHVTKIDPTGSRLIYSTGLNDLTGSIGSTTNTGLAVDSSGNAYVTGTGPGSQYPFTEPASPIRNFTFAYLTKLDPTGASVIFSISFGGGGIVLDSSGAPYLAGTISLFGPFGIADASPPPVPPTSVGFPLPEACIPNLLTSSAGAYIMKIDPATGATQDAQWIDGSYARATGLALAGNKLWTTGNSAQPDVPYTPGALTSGGLGHGPGALLAAIDFSPPLSASPPAIACVLDGADFARVGPVVNYQFLSIFGSGLGPAVGVAAPDGTSASIAGVTVTFDGNPAQLLYVSASQINLMVPAVMVPAPVQSATVMQVSVNGATVARQFPVASSNLSLFATPAPTGIPCDGNPVFQPLITNPDGSHNSCANPVKFGSLISLYVSGAASPGRERAPNLTGIQALLGGCPVNVENSPLIGLIYRVDVRLPGANLSCTGLQTNIPVFPFGLTLNFEGAPVGPLAAPFTSYPVGTAALPVFIAQ